MVAEELATLALAECDGNVTTSDNGCSCACTELDGIALLSTDSVPCCESALLGACTGCHESPKDELPYRDVRDT